MQHLHTDRRALRLVAATLAAALAALAFAMPSGAAATKVYDGPTPGVPCDKGSLPEATQGRAPLADYKSGRAAKGYTCNARQVGHFGTTGGFRVARYVDKAGHECGYYDTTLLFPKDTLAQGVEGSGTYVMDMTDPAKPVHTDTLRTPAFQSPHESVRVNQKRGLIVADMGYPTFNPGFVDVYDISADCRHPVFQSSTPLGVLGHESGFSPDGNTFYVGSLYGHTLDAVDLTNPMVPTLLWATTDYQPHGMSVSDDGNRLYMTESIQSGTTGYRGLTILDVSQVQKRVPNPTVPIVSRLTWPHVGTPQNAMPFTEKGHPYLAEIDEYGTGDNIGAARIIDIADERKPFVVSLMRLAVNQAAAQVGDEKNDPGATVQFSGYRGHYCEIPTRVDPKIVACTFIVSGLRVFNIEDVAHPQEVAYFNAPPIYTPVVAPNGTQIVNGSFAMAAPAFAPARNEIWYSDGNNGFFSVRLTAAAKRSSGAAVGAGTTTTKAPPKTVPPPRPAPADLPRTGPRAVLPALALLLLGVVAAGSRRRRLG
ncbi:MAG: hypothetical protein QOJ79_318 [Actinomycetota bacterium]|jgi:hypothetical protein|nr:hypothetical protein [Actinomycetota bacterium]